jgi:peptidyl-prolyl cis-trans isomerase SurA
MLRLIASLIIVGCTQVLADEIGMVVNNELITKAEVTENLECFSKFANLSESQQLDPALEQSVKEMLIRKVLIQDFADRNKITLTDEEEGSAISNYLSSVGTDKDFDEHVADMGVPPKWVREFIKSQALMGKVGSMVVGRQVQISDEEVTALRDSLYDENCQYLLRSWILPHGHEKANMEEVKKIKHDWAKTSQTPAEGEVLELGWKKKDELPSLFISAIEGIGTGNVVGPVVSENGYHLVWYEGLKVPVLPTLDELRNVLFQRDVQQKLSEWLVKLEDNSVVIRKS